MTEVQEDTYTYEIRLSVATCYINSEVYETVGIYDAFGFSDQEWDEMSNSEREHEVSEYLEDWVWQNVDTGWEQV